ncbi:unnamed protein product [Didymodactylos carnosus]|uniref:Endonuclease/exonuclease/phosphatase domain-containing protein n=1 Tax=Didymodactylos carnosus TaxID=1234261 RepID=A0A8S2FQQ9_9BILA|nr:unnamed protein product [Didymodactylos carnosus]CAF4323939.1 unnamed protein product [Didymodactylos carnosus]
MKQIDISSNTPGREAIFLLSYNILADLFADAQQYFNKTGKDYVSWPSRSMKILNEILSFNADIICLQEMQENHYHEWLAIEMLKYGYTGIYVKKKRDWGAGNDGCATFYRHQKVELVQSSTIDYTDYARTLEKYFRSKTALETLAIPTHSLGLYTLFRTHLNGKHFWVANTHITWHYTHPYFQLFQVKTLISELERLNTQQLPYLICGDFNSGPQSPVFEYLSTGKISQCSSHYESLKQVYTDLFIDNYGQMYLDEQHGLIQSIENAYCPKTVYMDFTNHDGEWYGILDYIWFDKNKLKLTKLLQSMLPSECINVLPNEQHPSDHLPLLAEFELI